MIRVCLFLKRSRLRMKQSKAEIAGRGIHAAEPEEEGARPLTGS